MSDNRIAEDGRPDGAEEFWEQFVEALTKWFGKQEESRSDDFLLITHREQQVVLVGFAQGAFRVLDTEDTTDIHAGTDAREAAVAAREHALQVVDEPNPQHFFAVWVDETSQLVGPLLTLVPDLPANVVRRVDVEHVKGASGQPGADYEELDRIWNELQVLLHEDFARRQAELGRGAEDVLVLRGPFEPEISVRIDRDAFHLSSTYEHDPDEAADNPRDAAELAVWYFRTQWDVPRAQYVSVPFLDPQDSYVINPHWLRRHEPNLPEGVWREFAFLLGRGLEADFPTANVTRRFAGPSGYTVSVVVHEGMIHVLGDVEGTRAVLHVGSDSLRAAVAVVTVLVDLADAKEMRDVDEWAVEPIVPDSWQYVLPHGSAWTPDE